MPRKLFVALVCCLLLATGAVTAQDWTGRARVKGEVLDPDGQPVEGAKVTLRAGDEGQGPEPIFTDKKGRWSYLGLDGGNWMVTIEKEGYLISEGQFPLNQFSANPPVIVNLKPIPEEMLREAAAAEFMAQLERGNELLAAGQFAEARAEYETVLPQLEAANQPNVLLGIARTYYQEENLAETEATLLRALAVDPNHVETLKLLSSLLVADGREQEARQYMDRLPEGEKLDANAYLNVGIDLYNEGKLDEALVEFEQVVTDFPDMPSGYYYRGLVLLNQGENDRARTDFQKFLELQPEGERAAEVQEFLKYLGDG